MSPQVDMGGEPQYRGGSGSSSSGGGGGGGDSRTSFSQGSSTLSSSPGQGSRNKYQDHNTSHPQDYPPPPQRFGAGPPLRHPPQEPGQQQHRQDSQMQRGHHHHHHHQPPSSGSARGDVPTPATMENSRPDAGGGHGSGESPSSMEALPRRALLFSSSPPSSSQSNPPPSSAEHGNTNSFPATRKQFHPINSGYRNEQAPYDGHRESTHNAPNNTSYDQPSTSSSRTSCSKPYNPQDRNSAFDGGRDDGHRQYHQHRRLESSEPFYPGSHSYGASYPPPHYHQQHNKNSSNPRQEHHFHSYAQDGYFRPYSDGRTTPSHEVPYPSQDLRSANNDGPRRPPPNSPDSRGYKHNSNGAYNHHGNQSHSVQASPNDSSQVSASSRSSRPSFGETACPPSDNGDQAEKDPSMYEEEGAKPQPSSSTSSLRRVTPEYHEDKLASHQPQHSAFPKQVESTPTRSDYDDDRRMLYGIQTGGMVDSPPRLSSLKHPRDGPTTVDTPAPMSAPPPPQLPPASATPSASTPGVSGRHHHYGAPSSVSAWSRPTPSPSDGTDNKENVRPGFGPGSSSSHHYQFGSAGVRSHQQTPYQHQDSYGEYQDTATPIRRDRSSSGPMYHGAYGINDPSAQDRHHYSHHHPHHPAGAPPHHHPYGDMISPYQPQLPWVGPPSNDSGHVYSTPAFRRSGSSVEPSPGGKAAAAVLTGRMSHDARYSYDGHGYDYYRPPHTPYEENIPGGYHRHHMEERPSSIAKKRPSLQSENDSTSTRTTSAPTSSSNSGSSSTNKASSSKPSRRKKMYSDYVGVTYNKTHAKFQACITHYRKQHYLGRYKLAVDAARAYDESAKLLKGNGWKINFGSVEEYERAKKRELAEIEEKKRKAEAAPEGGEAEKKPRISMDTPKEEGGQQQADGDTKMNVAEDKVDADQSTSEVKGEESVAISPQTPAVAPNESSTHSIPTSTPPDFKQELGPRRVSVETTELSTSGEAAVDSAQGADTLAVVQVEKEESESDGKRETVVITPTDERVPSPATTMPSSESSKVEPVPVKDCESGSTAKMTSTMATAPVTVELADAKTPQTVSPSGKENSESSSEAPRANGASQASGGSNPSGGGGGGAVLQNGTLAAASALMTLIGR